MSSGGGSAALNTLCDMYRAGMSTEKNVIIYRSIENNWWMEDDRHNCTHEELFSIIGGSFPVMAQYWDYHTEGERFYTGSLVRYLR